MNAYFNKKAERFMIMKDSYNKIVELGEKAGKYLTQDPVSKKWSLTDDKNVFNSDRTWKYSYDYDKEFDYNPGEPVPIYDCIAWSLGYIYTEAEAKKLLKQS